MLVKFARLEFHVDNTTDKVTITTTLQLLNNDYKSTDLINEHLVTVGNTMYVIWKLKLAFSYLGKNLTWEDAIASPQLASCQIFLRDAAKGLKKMKTASLISKSTTKFSTFDTILGLKFELLTRHSRLDHAWPATVGLAIIAARRHY